MAKLSSLLFGAGIGAGIMYFMDPNLGDRRRALIRDQVIRFQRRADESIETAVRDMRNRARGIMAEGMSRIDQEPASDRVIEERVRARLGFLTRHPRAVQVQVQNNIATISGDVLANEVDNLLAGVKKVRGVQRVENQLRVHETTENIPQLQGAGWMPGDDRSSLMWSPSTRLLAGASASSLLVWGMGKGGIIGTLAQIGGVALGVRALTNLDFGRLTGMTEESDAVRIRKTININAPVDQVYSLWSNFENFKQFMSNIEEIKDLGNGKSHWVVKGPAGSKVEFDAMTTENRPNEMIAWETTEDAAVKHRGQVRFRESETGTQVNVNMAYTPPAGVAGHTVAKLFGKDPKSEMNADLARMKSLLEEGKTTAKGQKILSENV